LFNMFQVIPDTTKAQAADMQLMSQTLKSSAHVPAAIEGSASTVNFWSAQPKAFAPKDNALLKSIASEVAKAK